MNCGKRKSGMAGENWTQGQRILGQRRAPTGRLLVRCDGRGWWRVWQGVRPSLWPPAVANPSPFGTPPLGRSRPPLLEPGNQWATTMRWGDAVQQQALFNLNENATGAAQPGIPLHISTRGRWPKWLGNSPGTNVRWQMCDWKPLNKNDGRQTVGKNDGNNDGKFVDFGNSDDGS